MLSFSRSGRARMSVLAVVTALLAVAGFGCTTTTEVSTEDLTVPVVSPVPSPKPAPTATAEPTATPPEPMPAPTATPSPTATATAVATPDPTATPPESTPTPGSDDGGEPTSTPLAAVLDEPVTPAPTSSAGQVLGEASAPDEADSGGALPPVDWQGSVRALETVDGIVLTVRGGGPGGWQVVTPCYELATVAGGRLVQGPIDVLIDPGHGGDEPGAVGVNGLIEAELNLDVSLRLAAALERAGYSVELTRRTDVRMAIQARTELAVSLQPTIFVSVHHNGGFPGPFDRAGTEVFHQKGDPESQRLGGLVFEEFQDAFADLEADWVATENFGVSWRSNERGTDLYGILRRTPDTVTVLTEAMYMTNPDEEALLRRDDVRQLEADALASAIDRWFTTTDPGEGYIEGLVYRGDLGPGGGTAGCVDPPLQ